MDDKEQEKHWKEEFDRLKKESSEVKKTTHSYKQVFIDILIFVFIGILIFYATTNPTVRSIIAGLIESSAVQEDFAVDIGEGNKLFFMNNTYSELIEIYDNNPEKEFKVCLKGEVANNKYFIDEIYEPTMIFQSHNRVISDPCPENTLVSMHSHPFRHCLPSDQDLKNFRSFKKTNPRALMAVMCEKGRFNFYR